jgi:GxxExxY protein
VYRIAGAAMDVFNEMGHNFLEPLYQESFAIEMTLREIPFVEQPPLNAYYKGRLLKKQYEPDYIAFEEIVVEIKTLERLTGREESQIINYLKVSRKPVGLPIDFGNDNGLEWKRFVN